MTAVDNNDDRSFNKVIAVGFRHFSKVLAVVAGISIVAAGVSLIAAPEWAGRAVTGAIVCGGLSILYGVFGSAFEPEVEQ